MPQNNTVMDSKDQAVTYLSVKDIFIAVHAMSLVVTSEFLV